MMCLGSTEARQDRLLEAAFPEPDDSRLLQDERFQERIAYVCKKMKVPSLRAEQVTVLRSLERRKDVCLLARTGFGKSLVFQSLYWMYEAKLQQKARDQQTVPGKPKRKITFVFVPLSGLGEEQVEALKVLENDPDAAFFYDKSKVDPHHLEDIFSGKYRMVYMSPEKALHETVITKLWANEMFRGRVNLVAVDEAHLVHDW
jgi:ATP-dependent DNA helicase RecQ